MKFTHFFKATIRKEQIASAFLATLLDEKLLFRSFFFAKAFPKETLALSGDQWKVEVEPNNVDVQLSTENTVVIIENKVRAGAKQGLSQLFRYYQDQIARQPRKRIFAVYLAPRQVGVSEIVDLQQNLQGDDACEHVSWEEVLKFVADGDSDVDAINSGFNGIRVAISDHPKYPHEGDRRAIAEIVDDALGRLRPLGVPLRRWTGREYENIYSHGTPLFTVWLDALFEAESVEPWLPKNVRVSEDELQLTIRAQFKLSAKAAKDRQMVALWERELAQTRLQPRSAFRRDPASRWFRYEHTVTGTHSELTGAMETVGRTLLNFLIERDRAVLSA